MLTLFTGLPGNGKTLRALQFVQAWALKEGRPVWYHGIKGLKPDLGWHELPTVMEKVNGREVAVPQWWLVPSQSIVLVDEAQNAGFGVRPRGVVPEWAQKLEVHRHLGIDLVFITQDPKLLDSHDRSLFERHFHLVRRFGTQSATIHEFTQVRENIKSRAGSIQTKWPFPKDVYGWYQSAEAHTHKARIPLKVYMLGAIAVALPCLCWITWHYYLDPKRKMPDASLSVSGATVQANPAAGVAGSKKISTKEWVEQQQPRLVGLAYSAPVYDDVTKPVEAPYPAACVKMGKRCGCYSQQATKLEVPVELCEGIVSGGFFVAWQLPLQRAVPLTRSEPRAGLVATNASAGSFSGAEAPIPPVVAPEQQPSGRGRALPRLPAPANAPS